jgi:hypothetical protein
VKDHYSRKEIEIEEDTRKWKDLLFLWIGRNNTMKIAKLWKATYRFDIITI